MEFTKVALVSSMEKWCDISIMTVKVDDHQFQIVQCDKKILIA